MNILTIVCWEQRQHCPRNKMGKEWEKGLQVQYLLLFEGADFAPSMLSQFWTDSYWHYAVK